MFFCRYIRGAVTMIGGAVGCNHLIPRSVLAAPPPAYNREKYDYVGLVNRVNELNRVDKEIALRENNDQLVKYFPYLKEYPIVEEEVIYELVYIGTMYGNKPIKSSERRVIARDRLLRLINKEGVSERTLEALQEVMHRYELL